MNYLAAVIGLLLFWVLVIGYSTLMGELFKKLHVKLENVGFVFSMLGSSMLFAGFYEARYPNFEEASWTVEFSDALYFEFLTPEGLVITICGLLSLYIAVYRMEAG